MGLVVDEQVRRLRNTAISTLKSVLDNGLYVETNAQRVQARTGIILGHGHQEGDMIANAAAQATACLWRALPAVEDAIKEAGDVDIMTWEAD